MHLGSMSEVEDGDDLEAELCVGSVMLCKV
jgi:hypothetical protein